jgi:hypothetical protein
VGRMGWPRCPTIICPTEETPASAAGMDRHPCLNPGPAGGNKAVSATRDRHSRGPDAPRHPDT